MTVLVTGIAGGLAQRTASLLLSTGRDVVGVDYRPVSGLSGDLAKMKTYRASYAKTAIEDVFRKHRFEAVLHLGRVVDLSECANDRFDLNVLGSQKIMNMCLAHKVPRLVVLSSYQIYGADPCNHVPISEEDPVRAGFDLPQLADAIQLDNMAVTWIYRHPDVRTVVLRPTNIVGPTVQNALCRFLRLPRVPYLAGFNPMTQFVHAHDLARAIERALGSDVVGVFNVGGAAVIPWRTALELAGAKTFPILGESLFRLYFHAAGLMRQYLADFYKYPCIIADARFRDTFGWQPLIGVRESIWATVAEARAHQEEQRARRTHAS